MPTYDGTYKLAVEDGRVLIRDVEGGSQSTHVPLEIYSNYAAQGTLTDSRQLRLRTQPYLESNAANAYVTDMGIQNTTDNYFFITAPQKTSNVGDQNTFVISSTSNIGIGTTDPQYPLHVVGNTWITGTLTASNIVGASPVTISSDLVMASGFTLTAAAIEPPSGVDSNMNVTGTLTTSNIVAQTNENLLISSNLEVGTSNLFVNTANGNVGIGTADPKTKLHVSHDLHLQASSEAWNSTAGPGLYLRYSTNGGQDEGYIQSIDRTTPTKKPMVLEASNFYFNGGDVGIGVASPNYTLDVNGGVRTRLPWLYARNTSQGGYSTSYNVTFNLVEARDTTVGDMYNTSYACTFPVKGVYVVDIFTHSALGGQHTAWYEGNVRYSNGTAYYLVSGNKQQSPTAANWDTYTENTWVLYVPTSNMYLDLTFYTSLSTIKNYAGSWNRIRAACIYAVQ